MSLRPRETLTAAFDFWNARDRAGWMSVCAPTLALGDYQGTLENWGNIYDVYTEGFPDLRWALTSVVEEGERVACEGTLHGTHTGTLRTGVRAHATGKSVKVNFGGFFKVVDGKIVYLFVYGLTYGLEEQLGVIKTIEGVSSRPPE